MPPLRSPQYFHSLLQSPRAQPTVKYPPATALQEYLCTFECRVVIEILYEVSLRAQTKQLKWGNFIAQDHRTRVIDVQ